MDKIGYLGLVLQRAERLPGRNLRTAHAYILHDERIQEGVEFFHKKGHTTDEAVAMFLIAYWNGQNAEAMVLANWLVQKGAPLGFLGCKGFTMFGKIKENGMVHDQVRTEFYPPTMTMDEVKANIIARQENLEKEIANSIRRDLRDGTLPAGVGPAEAIAALKEYSKKEGA